MSNCKKKFLRKIIAAVVAVYLLLLFVPPFTVEADKTFLHWVVVFHGLLLGAGICVGFLTWFIETCIAYTECDKEKDERV